MSEAHIMDVTARRVEIQKKKFSHWGTRKNDGYEESKG